MSSTTVTYEERGSSEVAPAERPPSRVAMMPLLLLLFFLSGACGLVYQQLWLRQLSLVFGVTVHAVATVLAAFFAGLALGSFLAGRYADRTRRPLRAYGVIEILVGVLALLTPAALEGVERIYLEIAQQLPDSTSVLTGARFALSFIVLLVPATLLGASLPVIVKSSLVRTGRVGERVSLLYATNTAGAIAGTVAAGFWLIGRFGVLTSFRVAAFGNIVIGIAALLLSSARERQHAIVAASAEPTEAAPLRELVSERARWVVLAAFTLSGLVAIGLEVVWFRILVLYLDSNTYAFTIMLATVLGGIAVGSYIAAPVMRWVSRSPAALAAIELAVAMAALLSVYLLSRTYDVADAISGIVGSTDADGLGFMLVASALAIVPATVLMGVAFPVGLYLFTGDARPGDDEVGRRVGIFYACNVAGGIVGSLLAGFVLVPTIGARRSIIVLAALLLVSGLLLATVVGSRRTRISLAAGSTALFVLLALFAVPDPYEAALAHRYPRERVLWLEEGVQTTVSIHQTRGGRVMYLDGLGQANDAPAVADFHRLIGTLPMALHPDPERALVVGLGGGVTAGAISSQPGVDVDVVELSSTVVDGARFFSHVNEGVVDGENVDMRIDDGRNYLLVTEDKYDVITADIILPEHAGAGKLWSVEYWELTRDALADDGIMLQWVPSHRSHDEYEMVLRSFLEVYPDATLWAGGSLLVGTKSPLVLDRADFDRKVADPATREYYAAANLGSFAALLYHYSAGPDDVRAAIGDGPLLTDDHPRIEYFRSLDVDPAPANPSKITGHVRDILPQ